MVASDTAAGVSSNQTGCSRSYSFCQNKDNLQHGSSTQDTTYESQHDSLTEMQDQSSSQYLENLYPGWRYDPNTGQWHQLDSPDTAGPQSAGKGAAMDPKSDVYYFQQTAQSFAGSVSEASTTESLSCWNQTSGGSTLYPALMVFDPQYPGWYYDAIAQKWRSLDSYFSSINQSVSSDRNQHMCHGSATGNYYSDQTMAYGQAEQVINYSHQQEQLVDWGASAVSNRQQDMNMAQPEQFGNSEDISSPENAQFGNASMSRNQGSYCADNRIGATTSEKPTLYERTSQNFDSGSRFNGLLGFNGVTESQAYAPPEQFWQHNNQCNMEFESFDKQFSTSYFNGPKVVNFSQKPPQSSRQSYASSEGRSSAGRPPHALVAFWIWWKAYGHERSKYSAHAASICRPGNVGAKELHKWVDDWIANCATQLADHRKGEALKMLFSLLKIACQFYGKLRSAFGTDLVLKENDCPESA